METRSSNLLSYLLKSLSSTQQSHGNLLIKDPIFFPHFESAACYFIVYSSYLLDLCASLHGVPLVSWSQDALQEDRSVSDLQ